MKIKKNFILREVAGTYIVVAVGEAVKNFKSIINLNGTGAFLWKKLEIGATEEELVKDIISEYQVEEEVAKKDVSAFIQRLKEKGLVE
jgi:hypothetical protein